MDYKELKIEDGIATLPMSELDKLCKLASDYRVLEHKLSKAEDKVRIYECIERDGYVVFSYESTDCDGTRVEGYHKCYSYKHVEDAIEELCDNAEGSVGYEIITNNVKEFKDESERRIYGGWGC